MNKTMTGAFRAMTIFTAATFGYSGADASTGGPSNEEAATNAAHTYVIRFATVDLSRIEGAVALYARIRQAASVVCAPLESRQLGLAEKHQACLRKAIADAVSSVNRPLLSQYHQWRTKGDRVGLVQLAKAN